MVKALVLYRSSKFGLKSLLRIIIFRRPINYYLLGIKQFLSSTVRHSCLYQAFICQFGVNLHETPKAAESFKTLIKINWSESLITALIYFTITSVDQQHSCSKHQRVQGHLGLSSNKKRSKVWRSKSTSNRVPTPTSHGVRESKTKCKSYLQVQVASIWNQVPLYSVHFIARVLEPQDRPPPN